MRALIKNTAELEEKMPNNCKQLVSYRTCNRILYLDMKNKAPSLRLSVQLYHKGIQPAYIVRRVVRTPDRRLSKCPVPMYAS